MTTTMPKRMSTEQRRAQLLSAGRSIFVQRAYDQVSTDEIANLTGTSKGLIYHYFGSKRGYYLATISASVQDLLAATVIEGGVGGMEASIRGYVSFVSREGRFFRAIVRGGIGADDEVDKMVGAVRSEIVSRVLQAIGKSEEDVAIAGHVWGWLGYAEGLGIHWVEERPFDEATLFRMLLGSFTLLISSEIDGFASKAGSD